MLKLYKDLRIGYFLAAFAGGVAIVLPPVWREEPFLPQALLGFMWIVTCAVIFEMLAAKRLNKLTAMMNECHVQVVLDGNENLHSGSKKTENLLRMNRSAAYLNIGRPRRAMEELQEVTPNFPGNASGTMQKICYYNNLMVAHLYLREIPQARAALEQYRRALDTEKLKGPNRELMEAYYQDKVVLLDLLTGGHDGAEEYLTAVQAEEKTPIRRVFCRYWLARICQQEGRTREADEHMRFVLRMGGDTWYAKEAAKALKVAD